MAVLTAQNFVAGAAGIFGVVFFFLATRHYWTLWQHWQSLAARKEACPELLENDVQYKYKPLAHPSSKTIRLLELLPAVDLDAPIRIRLRSVSLLDPNRPTYEALSYCWGDLADSGTVWRQIEVAALEDEDSEEPAVSALDCEAVREKYGLILIKQNLYGALLRLRLEDRKRLIWVDAMCINQEDDEEKSWQVRIMGDVYREADRVLIWLGLVKNESIADLERFIPQLLEAKGLKHATRDFRSYYQLRRAELKAFKMPSIGTHNRQYEAFMEIARSTYLRRTWIIQEFAMAKEQILVSDYWTIPWKSFEEAFTFLDFEMRIINHNATNNASRYIYQLSLTAERASSHALYPFLHLLSAYHQSQASDPRDKVFALKGLVTDADDIRIDYTKSVDQVYHDTAFRLIASSQTLDVLSVATVHTINIDLHLPSWVPDWRTIQTAKPLYDPGVEFGFSASAHSRYDPVASQDGLRLRILGYELDTISALGSSIVSPDWWKLWSRIDNDGTWAAWAHLCGVTTDAGLRYGPTGESIIQVFRKTLLLGDPTGQIRRSPQEEVERFEVAIMTADLIQRLPRWFNQLFIKLTAATYVLASLIFRMLLDIAGRGVSKEYRSMVFMSTVGRRMILTSRRFVGLTTAREVSVGDSVFLLQGGKIPYVLQKIRGEKDAFILVGDAYIHGYMHGKEWDSGKCREIWLG
ncbi:hypothetical protein ACEPPN_004734 [Leptodophora sp. 'Broadleaf-Isolate-01']